MSNSETTKTTGAFDHKVCSLLRKPVALYSFYKKPSFSIIQISLFDHKEE
jgi:hypothetical protein